MVSKIGLVGIGRMGHFMGLNLLRAGYPLYVHDLRESAASNLVQQGAVWCDRPSTLFESVDIVLFSLFDSSSVRDVIEKVKACDLTGKVIVDTTTIPPNDAQAYAQTIEKQGGNFIDAPVTGGESGAENGSLTIMVGGRKEVFVSCQDILETIGDDVYHLGPVGAGQAVKMANQGIMAAAFVAVAETINYLESTEVDVSNALKVLSQGAAASSILSNISQSYADAANDADGQANTRHYSSLFEKDARYAWQSAEQSGYPTPMVKLAHNTLHQVVESASYQLKFPLNILYWKRHNKTTAMQNNHRNELM